MRLNKEGWGFAQMIILSCAILVCLGVAAILIYNFYNNFANDLLMQNYYDLEENLKSSATEYINYVYDGTLTSTGTMITTEELSSSGFNTSLTDTFGNTCDGYVIASKTKGKVTITPYISCNGYETEGYDAQKK